MPIVSPLAGRQFEVCGFERSPRSTRGWLASIARWAPFRYMLAAPVELMVGGVSTSRALELVAAQWGWAAVAVTSAHLLWTSGVKRFEAYGA